MPPKPPQTASEVIAGHDERIRRLERQFPIIQTPAAAAADCCGCLGARVKRTTRQSIPDNTPTVVSLDTTVYDTSNFWDSASPTVFTMPEDGIFTFGCSVLWDPGSATTRALGFYVNLDHTSRIGVSDTTANGGSSFLQAVAGIDYYMQAGDVAEMSVYQHSGGSLDLVPFELCSIHFWVRGCGVTLPPIVSPEE